MIETLAVKERFALALSGGSTPRRLYQSLASPPLRRGVDWSRVEFFWSDERAVPPSHPEANFHLAQETLLRPLEIVPERVHRIQGERPDREAVARDYQDEIARVVGSTAQGEIPSFDLILLGLGADGHTASLFPATPALHESSRWVVRNPVLKLYVDRFTMTPMLINRAAHVFFLVTGAEKAEAVAEVLEGLLDTQHLPAQLIRPFCGELVWFLDEAAAAKLKQSPPK